MYDIGIIGGMGSQATVQLFNLIVNHTYARNDQEHINIAVLNRADIPDRTEFILGSSSVSPLGILEECVAEMNSLNVKNIIMPCNTAHYFIDRLNSISNCPVLNMVDLTLEYILNSDLPKKVCVLGTTGTVKCGIYEKSNFPELSVFYPDSEICDRVQKIIYDVKDTNTADIDKLTNELGEIMKNIQAKTGECTFCLACTELSVLNKNIIDKIKSVKYVDAMDILALTAIKISGHEYVLSDMKYDDKILRKQI